MNHIWFQLFARKQTGRQEQVQGGDSMTDSFLSNKQFRVTGLWSGNQREWTWRRDENQIGNLQSWGREVFQIGASSMYGAICYIGTFPCPAALNVTARRLPLLHRQSRRMANKWPPS